MSEPAESPAPTLPTHGRWALVAFLVLCVAGMGVTVELTVVYHQANRSALHRSHCSISDAWDCDHVARSPYSAVLKAPVSLWGFVAYGFMAFLAGWGLFRRDPSHFPLGLLALLVLGAIAMSGYLAYVAYVILKKKCLWCTVLYGVNAALTVALIVSLVQRRLGPVSAVRQDLGYLVDHLGVLGKLSGAAVIAAVVVLLAGPLIGRSRAGAAPPRRVNVDRLIKRPPQLADGGVATAPGPARAPEPPAWVMALVTPDTPVRGPVDADLYIVEFSDYECPFCQQSNALMEEVLRKHGRRIRMYHRHFPLDKTCFRRMQRQMHPHACFAASAAICAQAQGKFWPMNDGLFRLGQGISEPGILGLARQLGLASAAFEACLRSSDTDRRIQDDLAAGLAHKVSGTPSYFMGGPQIEQFEPRGVSVEFFDELFQKLDEQKRRPAGGAVPAGKP